jgi:hypothetical protein
MSDETIDYQPTIITQAFREKGDLGPLYAALAKARASFAPCVKNCSQAQPYPHEWASLDSIQDATVPALSANGLVVLQPLSANTAEGWMAITTRLAHSSGAYIETEVRAAVHPEAKWAGIGGACSYIRRYCITGLLNVAPEDDTDAAGADGHPSDAQQKPRAVPPKVPPAPKAKPEPKPQPKPAPIVVPPTAPTEVLPPEAYQDDTPDPVADAANNQPCTEETAQAIKQLFHSIKDERGQMRYATKIQAASRVKAILGRAPDANMTEIEGIKILTALRREMP